MQVLGRKNIVHCVKCFIRKMFCIRSIFIVFIAFAEFPKAEKNNKCCIIDFDHRNLSFKKQGETFQKANVTFILIQNVTKAIFQRGGRGCEQTIYIRLWVKGDFVSVNTSSELLVAV